MLEELQSIAIDHNATLVAVSKTKPNSDILALYEKGQRHFGENRVQELTSKYEDLPKDIQWHMIGHLQKNKVKFIAPFIHLIHSVDSLALLTTIEKEASKNKRTIPVLLQVHIATEESKFGLTSSELRDLIIESFHMEHIDIVGLMGMASFTHDHDQVRDEFKNLKTHFDNTKSEFFSTNDKFKTLSMGMSGDYEIALEEGSNMLRIGSLLFGNRA